MSRKHTVLFSAILAAFAVTAQAADLQPYSHKGQVIQRLASFDNPEGAIFSADGKHVFISNAAELGNPDKGFAWTNGAGYVSKLEVQSDGTLKIDDGTSMAAPMVSGVAALLFSRHPEATPAQVKQAIVASCTPIPELVGRVDCGGIVSAPGALATLATMLEQPAE